MEDEVEDDAVEDDDVGEAEDADVRPQSATFARTRAM